MVVLKPILSFWFSVTVLFFISSSTVVSPSLSPKSPFCPRFQSILCLPAIGFFGPSNICASLIFLNILLSKSFRFLPSLFLRPWSYRCHQFKPPSPIPRVGILSLLSAVGTRHPVEYALLGRCHYSRLPSQSQASVPPSYLFDLFYFLFHYRSSILVQPIVVIQSVVPCL